MGLVFDMTKREHHHFFQNKKLDHLPKISIIIKYEMFKTKTPQIRNFLYYLEKKLTKLDQITFSIFLLKLNNFVSIIRRKITSIIKKVQI